MIGFPGFGSALVRLHVRERKGALSGEAEKHNHTIRVHVPVGETLNPKP